MKFKNLPIITQIITPVLIALFLYAISTLISENMLRDVFRGAKISEASTNNVSKLMSAQRNIYRIRMTSAAAAYKEMSWEDAQVQYQELKRVIEVQLSELETLNGELSFDQESVALVALELKNYGETQTALANSFNRLDELYLLLPHLGSAISKINEHYQSNVVSKEQWRVLRPELYEASSEIQAEIFKLMQSYTVDGVSRVKTRLKAMGHQTRQLDSVNTVMTPVLAQYSKVLADLEQQLISIEENKVTITEQGVLLRETLAVLAQNAELQEKQASELGTSLIEQTELILLTSFILAALVALTAAILIAKKISVKVGLLSKTVVNMENGDLTTKTNINDKDELGQLCNTNDRMLMSLGQTVGELRVVGTDVASSATELASVMVELEGNALENKTQLERLVSSSFELAASSEQVAKTATEAEDYAKKGLDFAKAGVESSQMITNLSEDLMFELQKTSDVASNLEHLSNRVTEFVNLIENVAEQTNLLALNAAIEAARAGSSGRGFAVVADEVRVLAQKTSSNTSSIQELVHSLQDGSQDMVSSVKVCLEKVTRNAELAQKGNSNMSTLYEGIARLIDQNKEMMSAANEQSQTIASISDSIHQINDGLSQNTEGIKQSTETASFLSELAENQKSKLSYFKIS